MRAPLTREGYIPAGATAVRDRRSTAVAYVYTASNGAPAAAVFAGKCIKPAWQFRFKSTADRERRVRSFFEATQRVEKARADRRTARAAWVHPYKPGDLFSTCWGYDQTNREYFQVVEVRGKHLFVRQIRAGYVETQWCAGVSTPMPGDFIGDPVRVLAQKGGFRAPGNKQWASYDAPKLVAGVPTYGAHHVSSYH